jgi:L-ascorbate metabolism protein UlaG (beta-lactamase superfamily)
LEPTLLNPHVSHFPKHFDGKRFFNPDGQRARGFLEVLRWKLTSRAQRSPRFVDDVIPSTPPTRVDEGKLRITLVNHSTVLIQVNGFNLLTDPIWSERASPFTWAGPRRKRAPGVRWDDLPPIDAVLISHNHYDHLDVATLRGLTARGGCTFIVPLGLAKLLGAHKIGPVHELDWGESHAFPAITVYSVPAVHFSARTAFDRDRTLWCAYVIKAHDCLIYFAADTAFGDHFARVRETFGDVDVALLPIGAYEPRWFMRSVHMDPEEAVRAHQILGAKKSIAIHQGTFQLADEGLDVPRERLMEFAEESFVAPKNGEAVEIE